MIFCNGDMLAQGPQFSFEDVNVVTASIPLEVVRTFRGAQHSRGVQAANGPSVPRIYVDWALTERNRIVPPSVPIQPVIKKPSKTAKL